MKAKIDCNKLDSECLKVTADDMNVSYKHILKQIKLNYKFENGKKTDQFLDTTISVLDSQNFATLDIHVKEKLSISKEELEQADKVVYVEIDPTKTIIKPYKMEYGKAYCKISTDSVKITK